jgi:hypothetical protein
MPKRFECCVVTIRVPWKQGAPWPYRLAQRVIVDAMKVLGVMGWQVNQHIWGTVKPANESTLWPVNLWCVREIGTGDDSKGTVLTKFGPGNVVI